MINKIDLLSQKVKPSFVEIIRVLERGRKKVMYQI